MNDLHITTISQLREFLKGSQGFDFSLRKVPIQEKYDFIDEQVDKFKYNKLCRKDKRTLVKYLRKVTGYKHAQIHRLILRAVAGNLKRKLYKRRNPNKIYSVQDVKLLEKTDELHRRLNTYATKKILEREAIKFHKSEYSKISNISPSHIHNLRSHPVYQNCWLNHTKATQNSIGITQKPDNKNRPGVFRIDTVHQRDLYHINAVDDFIQWEIIVTVPAISQRYMEFVLCEIFDQVPFQISGFHADRGGEYINETVDDILSRMSIDLTKSRARKSNDNALVESKNGTIVRKNFGFAHVNQGAADAHNKFNREYFNPYLNFHRPCAYPTEDVQENGRVKKLYKAEDYEIPYEKLKQASKTQKAKYLKSGTTFKELDIMAYAQSDNDFANLMRKEQRKLSNLLHSKVVNI